jgi:hypothetical protein
MKNKYLKERKQYVTEHFATFFNDNGSDNTESLVDSNDEEELETELVNADDVAVIGSGVGAEFEIGSGVDKDTIEVGISVTHANDELPSNVPSIVNELPQVSNVDTFIPSPNNSYNNMKQGWAVIKCMTTNGIRVGLDKQNETDCEVLAGNLSYDDAVNKIEEIAMQQGVPAFNDDLDEYVGRVSKAYVKKPVVSNTISPTSYRPNINNTMGGAL